MAAASHKGGISFGLVYIPVALYTATKEENISFNQLHKECGNRIKQKKACTVCNIVQCIDLANIGSI